MGVEGVAEAVVRWQRVHGRHGLPWQADADPYKIWVSEIMLQQTQVATVIPYFEKFMRRFPTVAALARARQGSVMALWSGLGYYARARNLHAAAKIMAKEGVPDSAEAWRRLPGVGRSTAAAVAVFSRGERGAILDGNVKRVLARVFAVEAPAGTPAGEAVLWPIAESLLPAARDIRVYSQGMMDIGALVCVRGVPLCGLCPLAEFCEARRRGAQADYPVRVVRRARAERRARFVLLRAGGRVLLRRMPSAGVWGGLWSLPDAEEEGWRAAAGGEVREVGRVRFCHEFTHFRLHAVVAVCECEAVGGAVAPLRWHALGGLDKVGLPAPVRRVLVEVGGVG